MNIREEYIVFLHCKWGLSGAQLAKLVLEALNYLTLSIEDCSGYDGASSVAGHINGLSAHILRLNQKALYTHCYSHKMKTCKLFRFEFANHATFEACIKEESVIKHLYCNSVLYNTA
ncbi:Hypothetical predicted protein, partial [Paramuricea clavata]